MHEFSEIEKEQAKARLIRPSRVMVAGKDGEWHQIGSIPTPGTVWLDGKAEDDIKSILRHKATYTSRITMKHIDPVVAAILAGVWVTGSAKDELRWRLNERQQGRDPGRPLNWPGIDAATSRNFVSQKGILRASTDSRRTS